MFWTLFCVVFTSCCRKYGPERMMIFCPGDRLVFVLWLSACQSMTFPWVSIRYQKKITHIFHMGRRHKCTKLSVLLVRTLASTCVTDSTPRRCDRVSTRYSVDFVEKNGIRIIPTNSSSLHLNHFLKPTAFTGWIKLTIAEYWLVCMHKVLIQL